MTATPTTDDHSLLRAYAASGDAEAFAELARRYAGLVLAVAQRITRSAHDAEDITQTCFLELAKNAASVRSIPGYLHRAATTRALNFLRNENTRRAHESKSPLHSPDLTWQQLMPLVDHAINQLPDDLRLPLILHYQQSQSQSDIAAALKLSQPTVSRRLESAIAQLRQLLNQMGEGAGVAVGGLTAATTSVALLNTAASPPPAVLLSSLYKIGLAGVGKTAAVLSTASLAKVILLLILSTTLALLLMYAYPRHPPTPVATPIPIPESSSSSSASISTPPELPPPAAPTPPPVPTPSTLTRLNAWQSLYPNTLATLSPDSTLLLSASSLHTESSPAGNDAQTSLVIFDPITNEPLQTFHGHSRYITAIAFAPNNALIASASRDSTVRIWDPLSGEEMHHIQLKDAWFTAVTFSPDSKKILAAAGTDMDTDPHYPNSLLLYYDLATDKPLAQFPFDHALITALALSPDGNLAAVATNAPYVSIINLTTAKEIYRLTDGATITALAFSPNSKQLLTAGQSQILSLWDLTTPDRPFGNSSTLTIPRLVATLTGHNAPITALAFPNSLHAISAGPTAADPLSLAEIRIWNLSTQTSETTLKNLLPISSLSLNENATQLLTASPDGTLTRFHLALSR